MDDPSAHTPDTALLLCPTISGVYNAPRYRCPPAQCVTANVFKLLNTHSIVFLLIRTDSLCADVPSTETLLSSVLGFSTELLLLPPRSAPHTAPHTITRVLLRDARALLLFKHRSELHRHPFSGQPNSVGTLQHVSYRMTTSMPTAPLSIFAYTFPISFR